MLLFVMLCIRLYYIAVYQSTSISVMKNNQYSYIEKTSALNYNLLDTNGNSLLTFKYRYYVVIDPTAFDDNYFDKEPDAIDSVKYILKNYNPEYILPSENTIDSKKTYYEVDKKTYNLILKTRLNGLYAYEYSDIDKSSCYKLESILATTKNTIDNSDKSKNSLEMKILNDAKGFDYPQIFYEKDVNGIITNVKKTKSNKNLVLTIDKSIEEKIQNILDSKNYNSFKQIGAVLMQSNNGEIKAMVQKDYSEPNVLIGGMGNGFEPGSIFKTIVEEAALEKGSISTTEKFTSKGIYDNEENTIGTFDINEAYIRSINDVFAQVGNKAGVKSILKMAQSQGILNNQKVLGLEDEKTGTYVTPSGYGEISLLSIGQNMQITPLQALSIPNTLVNDGIYIKPRILKNDEVQSTRVISSKTSQIIKNQMAQTVKSSNATGTAAYIAGVDMGGKTGTSTRMEKDDKGKMVKHSDGWFAGFFKANDKYYTLVVYVKDINTESEFGGTTAAPVFREIVKSLI